MRILALAAAAFLWAGLPARAQPGGEGPPEGGAQEPGGPQPDMRGPGQGEPPEHPMLSEDFAARLAERLKLSDEQKSKVSAILSSARPGLKKRAQDIKDLQNKMKGLHDELRKAMGEIREKIRAELDGEQRERFDSMRPPDGGTRGGMRRRPGPPEGEEAPGGMRGEGRDMPPPEIWRAPQGGDGQPPKQPPPAPPKAN